MLVLQRSNHERVIIGKAGDVLTEPILIDVVGFRGKPDGTQKSVRLAISAQRDVVILRDELIEQPTTERPTA